MNKPTGLVTFLFTDIEGSTRLSQEFPGTLPAALDKHHSILTNAIESNSGFIFEIVGDAFYCAFKKTSDAVKAAVEAQLNLANEKWEDAVIKARMGIHSGNVEWNGKIYMGYITLARAARVMSAAYGEQIIISNDAYELCHKDPMPQSNQLDLNSLSLRDFEAVTFRDLGERRLKDVIRSIRLYQVVSKGLREDFPPLKTLDARPNNLPVQLSGFIGREEEMRDAKKLLKDTRLLTLTGSGGAGKTRFALQTGADMIDDFANGVWFVELAAINDPFLLPRTIISAFALKEESQKTQEEIITEYLKDKEILIIIDNCEHLIDACAKLTERLLAFCPKLKIIAASREALNCKGEQTYSIPPLTQPDPALNETPEQLTQYESVRLFIETALAVNPRFRVNNENAPALAEICSRLDGLPLAIELAASRIKVLSVEKIYEKLDDRFKLLTGGKRTALPRQQTLRALIDWSYDLLSEKEKILWSRVSVFAGGWTLEAAEEVCSDGIISNDEILDLLSQLSEKSIIIFDGTKERYWMLESLRHYGEEKLTDKNETYSKHLNYFAEFSKREALELFAEQSNFWLDKFETDHNNFISAIEWSVSNRNTEKGALTANALGTFWTIRGHYSTARRLLEIIMKDISQLDKYYKGRVINLLGIVCLEQGDYELAQKYIEEGLGYSREMGDKKMLSSSLNNFGNTYFHRGNNRQSQKYYEESLVLSREIGHKRLIVVTLSNLGNVFFRLEDYEKAQKCFLESLVLSKEIGYNIGIATSLSDLGYVFFYNGDYEQAQKYLEESLEIYRNIGDKRGISHTLDNLANVFFSLGYYEKAQKFYEESLALSMEIGKKFNIGCTLNSFADILRINKSYPIAVKLLSASEKALEPLGLVLDKRDQQKKDENIAKLHEQLSDEEFLKYWEEGKMITLEEACKLIVDN